MRTSLVDTVVRGVAPVLRAELGAAHARIVTLERDAATMAARYDALVERLAAVEARAQIPGRDGRDGERGERGLDGAPGGNGRDGIDGLPGRDGKDGRDGLSPDPEMIREAIAREVTRHIAAFPPQVGPPGPQGERGEKGLDGTHGRDGVDGKDGMPGRDGKDGVDGKDGKDGQPGRDGRDGLPGVAGEKGLDGKDGPHGVDGKDGRDGLSIEDIGAEFDVETKTIHLWVKSGDVRKDWYWKVPLTIHRGVWEAGRAYEAGDQVTHSGSHWTARDATTARPGGEDRTWVLSTKRGPIGPRGENGADGKDGRPGRDLTQMDDTGRKW